MIKAGHKIHKYIANTYADCKHHYVFNAAASYSRIVQMVV